MVAAAVFLPCRILNGGGGFCLRVQGCTKPRALFWKRQHPGLSTAPCWRNANRPVAREGSPFDGGQPLYAAAVAEMPTYLSELRAESRTARINFHAEDSTKQLLRLLMLG